jgi:DNA (cytosine-5)-methyltransferase 1
MIITANSYFSGIGLLDLGLMQAGIVINSAFELDADACKTYRANHQHKLIQCDLSQQLVMEQESCDIMAFTYPCTKYSTMADINGTRTGDDLFLHALRHLAIARPEAYMVENVPGMRAFPVVMEAMSRLPDYYVQVFCPIKTETWLPQRRDRLIIIGTRRQFAIRPPEGTRAISLADVVEADPQVTLPTAIATRMSGQYRDLPIISDPAKGDIAPTCIAHYAKDKSTRLIADKRFPLGVRPYSVREYARLQGIPDSFKFPVSETAAYRQIGNGEPVDMGRWAGKELVRYFKHRSLAA